MKTIKQTYRDTPVAELRRHPRNAKRGATDTIRRSISDLGFYGAVIAQTSTGYVLAGNHRLEAAAAEGAETLPVFWVDVDEETATKILLVDNRSGELGTTDSAALLELLRSIDPEAMPVVGYTADDVDALLREVGPPPQLEPQYEDDDAPDEPDVPVSEPGQVYELGPHRLVCGDSTTIDAYRALMDEAAQMLWCDPPYGVAYVGKTKDALKIQNDDLDPARLHAFLAAALGLALENLVSGGATYVAAPAGPLNVVFGEVLNQLGCYRQGLVWAKESFALGRSDYHYRHEPVFYGWKPGGPHRWYGGRREDTVHVTPKPARSKVHPTMKPVGLITRHIANSSKTGDVVLDCFGGSGSTLIACAMTERRARLIELSPGYCDVIRRRWTRWARSRDLAVGPGGLDG